jgi:hypothetical protein
MTQTKAFAKAIMTHLDVTRGHDQGIDLTFRLVTPVDPEKFREFYLQFEKLFLESGLLDIEIMRADPKDGGR